jgi:hypothetical protein
MVIIVLWLGFADHIYTLHLSSKQRTANAGHCSSTLLKAVVISAPCWYLT